MKNKLWTKEIEKKTPRLYEMDGKDPKDVKITFKIFDPYGSFTWYITEANFDEGLAFGLTVSNQCPEGELGYISLTELASIRRFGRLPLERDRFFGDHTLEEVKTGKAS